MKRQSVAQVFLLTITLAMSANGLAQELSVRGGHSGYWFNPDQGPQAVSIEVMDLRSAAVNWITYDAAGEPVWLAGFGSIRGNTIEAELNSFRGGRFPTAADAGQVNAELWGTAEIEFSDCNSAEMRWDTASTGFASGALSLTRLTGIEGNRCGQAEAFERTVSFSFEQGAGPWTAMFADFTEATQDSIMPESGWAQLPQPLEHRNGFRLAGSNASDDLTMFLKAPIHGLQPELNYRVELDMSFATQVPQNCVGIGGAPGESVGVKLGASGTEPLVVENQDGSFRFNIDTGGGPVGGGENARLVGDMSNFQEECVSQEDSVWQLKTVSTRGEEFSAVTDASGTLWIYGGSDSGFEGRTRFFVTDFIVRLTPAS
ncbi:MAG: hypothetical protein WD396_03715 [Pseudohongiellaceae bacterium]